MSANSDEMLQIGEPLKSTKSEAQYLRDIIEKLPGSIFWKNTKGEFLGCNYGMAKIYRISSPAEIIGKTNKDFLDPKIAEELEKIDRGVYEQGEEFTIEEVNITDKGEKEYYLTQKAPLFDEKGNIIGLLGASIDITSKKEAEQKIKESNEKIVKLNKLKSEFINNMQHDLRTPLSSLYMIMDLLRKEEQNSEKNELYELGFAAAKELLNILDEFVNFRKYETDFIFSERKFNLKETALSIIKLEGLTIKQKNLAFNFKYDENCPIQIISDEYRIRSILINILSNAIKFTEKGSIELKIKIAKKINEREAILLFRVKDTGKGISKENQRDLFEKFKKIDASNSGSYRGMGMGLYISRRFLDELSGELYLTSELDKGSEFSWAIPVKIPLI